MQAVSWLKEHSVLVLGLNLDLLDLAHQYTHHYNHRRVQYEQQEQTEAHDKYRQPIADVQKLTDRLGGTNG